tara:strand:+ start:7020 stop:8264 length:1245 start_codon:yes stop_codon:yes gene_type:complete
MAIKGELSFPGDKSISHRALMVATLGNKESIISNLSTGADVLSTKHCLESCGIQIKEQNNTVIVKGGSFEDPKSYLNCGNSGTTARILIGLLAGQGINATFIGDSSLSSRPMERILNPLSKMGLKIQSKSGKMPITIRKSNLKGIEYELPVPSAQVKSSIMLAGLGANSVTSIIEKVSTRNHTELMLESLGVNISYKKRKITVSNSIKFNSLKIEVPSDPSTAAFFIAAAILIPDSFLILKNILVNPTRVVFINILKKMGAKIDFVGQKLKSGELISDIHIEYSNLKPVKIEISDIPGMIDEIPILAVIATQINGVTKVKGAKELRFKECDRIKAICHNLNNMGANIEQFDDGFIIKGPSTLNGTTIKTFNDHRIAMAFSIAGLIAKGKTNLDNPKCVEISFPEFHSILNKVTK